MFLKDLKIKDLVFIVFLLFSSNTLAQSLSFEEVDTSDFIKSLSTLSNSQSLKDRNFETSPEFDKLILETIIQNNSKQNILEKSYSNRAGRALIQKGYDGFFINYLSQKQLDQTIQGGIQNDYLLGHGDEIVIILEGGQNLIETVEIERNGLLAFSFLEPVNVSGLTFGELKKLIISKIKNQFVETKAYLTIREIKQINVSVAGEVNIPGKVSTSGLSNVLDVLYKAGGVKKSGTLRKIKIQQNEKIYNLDLYDYLFGNMDGLYKLPLVNNNTLIIVPPIGDTVAISGDLINSGIYELEPDGSDFRNFIDNYARLHGGPKKEIFVQRFDSSGNEIMTGKLSYEEDVKNGDIIYFMPKKNLKLNVVNVIGAVRNPFSYPLDTYPTLKSILTNENIFNDNAYLFSVVLKSTNDSSLKKEYETINIAKILAGEDDRTLSPGDEIIVLSKDDRNFFLSAQFTSPLIQILSDYDGPLNEKSRCKSVNNLIKNFKIQGDGGYENNYSLISHILKFTKNSNMNEENNIIEKILKIQDPKLFSLDDTLLSIGGSSNNLIDTFKDQLSQKNEPNVIFEELFSILKSQDDYDKKLQKLYSNLCPSVFEKDPNLLEHVLNNSTLIRGSVKNPGIYPRSPGTNFSSLLVYAGFNSGKPILSPDKATLDVISNSIKFTGAIRYPLEIKAEGQTSLKKIINSTNVLGKDTYPLFGIILRSDQISNLRTTITFNPVSVLSNKYDKIILSGDEIKFYSEDQISQIVKIAEQYDKIIKTENIDEKILFENKDNIKIDGTTDNETFYKDNNSLENILNSQNTNLVENFFETSNLDNIVPSSEKNGINLNDTNLNDLEVFNQKTSSLINEINFKTEIEKIIPIREFDIITKNLVNVTGSVISPGFYPVGDPVSALDLITQSGGFTSDARINSIEISNISNDKLYSNHIAPGGKLFVPSNNLDKKSITISGSVFQERNLGYKEGMTLSDIFISIEEFQENSDLYFSVIYRNNSNLFSKEVIAFSPIKVINQEQNQKLSPGDKIKIFTIFETDELIKKHNDQNLSITPEINSNFNNKDQKKAGTISELVRRFIIRVEGAVSNPGARLIVGNFSLKNIIDIFGGFTNEANTNEINILFPKKNERGDFTISEKLVPFSMINNNENFVSSGSLIRVAKVRNDFDNGFASIQGAVLQPGKYQIMRNDTIFDLLKRSGGLDSQAFLEGLIFSRNAEKAREEKSVKLLQKELDKALTLALENAENKVPPADLAAIRMILNQASNFESKGRVIGDFTNIDVLKSTSLKSGDVIYIPKRPSSITIVGEIMSPGSVIWDKGLSVDDYIKLSAGFTELADEKKVFVISPNGRAERKNRLWGNSNSLKPGSTIIIPRKFELTTGLQKVSAITSVVYQLTLTFAGLKSLLE